MIPVAVDNSWFKTIQGKMPHSKFYTLTEEAFKTIANSSSMPVILNSISMARKWGTVLKIRVAVGFADFEAQITCHIVCRAEDKGLYTGLFNSLA